MAKLTARGYKLVDSQLRTHGGFQWEIGRARQIYRARAGRRGLCSNTWLHYYQDPLLAVLHAPIHVPQHYRRLLVCAVGGKIQHEGWIKSGCTWLKPLEEIPLPTVTPAQRVRYAIYCAQRVCHAVPWNSWAATWLSGQERGATAAWEAAWAATAGAAGRAAEAAWAAAEELAAVVELAAGRAAWAAAEAARRAAWAATEAAERAAEVAELAAAAAERAAELAAAAARRAAEVALPAAVVERAAELAAAAGAVEARVLNLPLLAYQAVADEQTEEFKNG